MRFLTSDWSTKLMALLLAAAVWYYLDQQATKTLEARARIDFAIPEGAVVLRVLDGEGNEIRGEIPVRIRGPKRDVEMLRLGTLACAHAVEGGLRGAEETRSETLISSDFNVPTHLSVEAVPSPRISVVLARQVQRRVRVRADAVGGVTGLPRPGFRVKSLVPMPEEVLVRGPASLLEDPGFREIPIVPVSVEGRQTSFRATGRIPETLEGKPVRLDEPDFRIEVVIEEVAVVRREKFPVAVLLPAGLPYRVTVDPAEVEVELEGPPDVVAKAAAARGVTVLVDLSARDAASLGTSPRILLDLQATVSPGVPRGSELKATPMPDADPKDRKATVTLARPERDGTGGEAPR